MANVPYPLTSNDIGELRMQVQELIRQVFEEKIGGADLGDVFSLPGDVLTLVLADTSGLTKSGNKLSIDAYSAGGMQLSSNGLAIKIIGTGGLETSVSGLGVKLNGTTLTLGAAGISVTPGIHAVVSTDDVTAIPTALELTTAFGTPAAVGSGFIGVVNDNNAGSNIYLAISDGTNWHWIAATKAL